MESIKREWLTYKEAAELVGLSRKKLWELIAAGEVEAAKAGKAVRINRRSLEDYMRRHAFVEA